LNFFAADLESDAGWPQAVAGCDYVLHVASPFPPRVPKDENELIIPAREGALRVLHAARDAGVKRVVLTSSFAAIAYGHPPQAAPFTEDDWTDLSGTIPVAPYQKSKTLAEQAAWDFVAREGAGLELSVVNPVGVFGPVLGPDYATSILLVQRLLKGNVPGCPNLAFGIVDVRDVVSLHLLAMTHPTAAGERFLAVAGNSMTFLDVAQLLKARLGAAAKRVPARSIPDWVLRVFGLFDATARGIVPELGKAKESTHEKATRVLGWTPRSNEEAILATAESLIRLGLV
jgi:nucleoside-diphosphate-sugar epimerase